MTSPRGRRARATAACALSVAVLHGAGAAAAPRPRLLSVEKDQARLVVELDEPATAEVAWGEELFAWTGRSESPEPATRHELVLGGLAPDRPYFYQVLVDGAPASDVLVFRSGRSWVARRATVLVSADTPDGARGERAAAEALFGAEADVLLVLGGDAGRPDLFRDLHGRTMAERLVLPVGGPDGAGGRGELELVTVSDVALALLGGAPVARDTQPSPALQWAAEALAATEGTCWPVVVTSASLEPGTPEASQALTAAREAGAELLVSRSPAPGLDEREGVAWLRLSEPDESPDVRRHHARLHFESGALQADLVGADGTALESLTRSKECPLPRLATTSPAGDPLADDLGLDDPMFGESDFGGLEEDCDTY